MSWSASPTSDVTYNVYASATPGLTPAAANRIASGLTATAYQHTGLPESTTRYYVVTAQSAGSESAASNQAMATTPAVVSCAVEYAVVSQWHDGFGAAISIKNTGSGPINGWRLTWSWPGNQQITQAWNANDAQTGQSAALTNVPWNSAIAPGTTLTGVGLNASYSGANTAPTAFYLNGTRCQ